MKTSIAIVLVLLLPAPLLAASIVSVLPLADTVPTYDFFEIDATLGDDYDNPFDPAEIDVTAVVETPARETVVLPAFWYEPYDRELDGDREVFTPAGEGRFRLRYAPPTPGIYTLTVRATDAAGTVEAPPVTLTAASPASGGFIRVDADNPRYFAYDDGAPYLALGFNVDWVNDASGGFAYTGYLDKLAAGGGNWTRLWLSHFAQGTILEWGSDHPTGYYQGLGRYSQQIGKKLDDIFAHAQDLGVAIQLVLHQHSQFKCIQWSSWDENPYNAANGGPCATSADYFTEGEARRLADNLHRYLAARYGAYRSLLAWEIFNEADGISGVRPSLINPWMLEVADDMRAWDPAGHPITTSYALPLVLPYFDLSEWDFNNRHQYVLGTFLIQWQIGAYLAVERPVILAEFGIDYEALFNDRDPLGINIHNGTWIALLSGYAGGAMNWWWDNYIEPQDLWGLNAGPRAFFADEPLANYDRIWSFDAQTVGRTLDGYALGGTTDDGRRVLGWVHDPRSNWLHGLDEPETFAGAHVPYVADSPSGDALLHLEVWDAWTGEVLHRADWEERPLGDGFELPVAFVRDVAFKLTMRTAADDDTTDDDAIDDDAIDDDSDDDAVDDDDDDTTTADGIDDDDDDTDDRGCAC